MIMSSLAASAIVHAAIEEAETPRAGFLSRLLAAIVQSRTREARRRVALHIERLGEEHLAHLGFSDADIEAIRAGTPVADVLARRAS
jgi:hypothetical protein